MPEPNRLASSTSLYLRQHGHNPVDWYPWGDEALAKARAEDKMIFLSIGYSSCHWCHVMEQESFEDVTIAKRLNDEFVPIKVDREERPDLDSIYMEAVQMMSGQGGWPLNVWLTPDLKPVYGGTYYPPHPMHSRPSFAMVLDRLSELWSLERAKLLDRAAGIADSLTRDLYEHLPPAPVEESLLGAALTSNKTRFDATYGGFGSAPKFPMAMWLSFLWRREEGKDMVLQTLLAICRGGIYDQIGGGFHRYSTDERWLVPHFEKMLYDQALLLKLLSDVWAESRHPLLKSCIDQTGHFLDREMKCADGGYGSALDADNAGSEGGFYTWTHDEITLIAPECGDVFYLPSTGNWEGRIILERHSDALLPSETIEKLLQYREQRERPAFDPKRLTSWNAMLLSAFVSLHQSTCDDIWKTRALNLAEWLHEHAYDTGSVKHISGGGDGFSQDYGTLCEAFCRMYELSADAKWLNAAESIAEQLIREFHDETTNSFYFARPSPDLLYRKKEIFDHAEPSGNSASIAGLFRLGRLTMNLPYTRIAEQALNALSSVFVDHAMSLGVALQVAQETRSQRSELVLCGDDGRFMAVQAADADPSRILIQGDSHGKSMVDGKPTAWLCTEFECQAPIHTPDELADALQTRKKGYL